MSCVNIRVCHVLAGHAQRKASNLCVCLYICVVNVSVIRGIFLVSSKYLAPHFHSGRRFVRLFFLRYEKRIARYDLFSLTGADTNIEAQDYVKRFDDCTRLACTKTRPDSRVGGWMVGILMGVNVNA